MQKSNSKEQKICNICKMCTCKKLEEKIENGERKIERKKCQ